MAGEIGRNPGERKEKDKLRRTFSKEGAVICVKCC